MGKGGPHDPGEGEFFKFAPSQFSNQTVYGEVRLMLKLISWPELLLTHGATHTVPLFRKGTVIPVWVTPKALTTKIRSLRLRGSLVEPAQTLHFTFCDADPLSVTVEPAKKPCKPAQN